MRYPAIPTPAPILLLLGLLTLLLGGCVTGGGTVARPDGPAPTYADLAEQHNTRVELLQRVYARGVVELEWTDEDGDHFEQGDAQLWLDLPRRTALNISKVGDTLIWIGSDQDRYWFFDLLGDPTSLTILGHDELFHGAGPGRAPVRPLVLLAAIGLTPMPVVDEDTRPPRVRWWSDDKDGGWSVDVPAGPGGADPVTFVFEPDNWRPIRVIARDAAGEPIMTSVLREYRPVPVPGMSVLMHPRMAEVAELTDPAGGGAVRLYLRDWTGDVAHQPMDRVFDLERLTAAMRPAVVDETSAP